MRFLNLYSFFQMIFDCIFKSNVLCKGKCLWFQLELLKGEKIFYTFYEKRSSVSGNRWFQSNPTIYVCMKLETMNVAYSM